MRRDRLAALTNAWGYDSRWRGCERPYTAEDVVRLGGSLQPECTFARRGAERFWDLLKREPFIRALGAVTGNQAIEQVQASLKAIYVSGWQVAADANCAGEMYPDQSLYPCESVPQVVRRINHALLRADEIHQAEGKNGLHWFAPIVADGESGFGGPLNAFELMKAMIEAGAAAVHFEDQASNVKKCGHMGGKVVVPVREFIAKLVAARLASDILDVPTVLIARTDAAGARLLQSDVDPVDTPFITGGRTYEGYYEVSGGLEYAIRRALAFAPYADMIWCETSSPDLGEAREFAAEVHEAAPGKLLAYNCSPSFHWRMNLGEREIARFQDELAQMGYKFQFVTLAGFHSLNSSMYELARGYSENGMSAYSRLQEREFWLEQTGYTAIKHQHFVGVSYFDEIQSAITGGKSSTKAMEGSTELQQFA